MSEVTAKLLKFVEKYGTDGKNILTTALQHKLINVAEWAKSKPKKIGDYRKGLRLITAVDDEMVSYIKKLSNLITTCRLSILRNDNKCNNNTLKNYKTVCSDFRNFLIDYIGCKLSGSSMVLPFLKSHKKLIIQDSNEYEKMFTLLENRCIFRLIKQCR